MKILFLLPFLSVILLSGQYKNQRHTNDRKNIAISDSLTKNLQRDYQKEAIIGFSTAIVNDKGLVYDQGFGYTDIEQKKAYTSATVQNIASISKTLIGISLLKAQELGKLNINDPINKYLPFKIFNPNYPETPILIKHLAYHTSSITDLDEVYGKSYVLTEKEHADNEGVYDYFNAPESNISLLKFIENSLTPTGKWYSEKSFLNFKPGEKREYSNIAAALCALVIESATGEDYRSFTKKHIITPLQMKSSGWSSNDTDGSMRSRLFASKKKMIASYSLITYADGGFITSSHDLGLFLSELIKGYGGNGTLLNKKSYQKLFEKKRFTENGKSEDYGIFMEFRDGFLKVPNEMTGHNGSDPGVFTAMYFNPKTKTGKVVLVNTDTDFSDAVWPEIEAIWKSLSEYEKTLKK